MPHPPHHGHHHRHGLRISDGGIDHATDVLAQYFEPRTAAVLVEQGLDGPPEPASSFMLGVASAEKLTGLLRAAKVTDLKALGKEVIDPRSDAHHGLSIAEGAAAPLQDSFPKDASKIEEALAEGPSEMRAAAVVHTLNLNLLAVLTRQHTSAAATT